MISLAILVSVFTLINSVAIHFAYKAIRRKRDYTGITLVEGLFIWVGSVPGLGGCAVGWTGFTVPLPLMLGVPLHIALLGGESCGWTQSLIFDDPYLTRKFVSFPIAWGLTNSIITALLYTYKIKRKNS
jgi:hypothetical protein